MFATRALLASARQDRLGFIGLGVMGNHMLKNLISKSAGLKDAPREFIICDAQSDVADRIGLQHQATYPGTCVTIANNPREVVEQASTIISMVPASAHVKDVYLGGNGVLEGLANLGKREAQDTLCIDESTIEQSESRKVAQAIKSTGAEMIDAPVSGGAMGARDGTLTIMVGGSEAAFERGQKVLQLIGRRVLHCGDLGAGLAAKLANNLLLAISMAGVSEVMLLGKRLGLNPQQLADIINISTGRCWASEVNNPEPQVSVGNASPPSHNEYRGGFAMRLAHKDMVLAIAAAKDLKTPVPLGAFAETLFRPLAQPGSGYDGLDFSAFYKHLEVSSTG